MWRQDFFEAILREHRYRMIAGVDEVGRGALAGPVVAAAVILEGEGNYEEIRDSKVLSPRSRERIASQIHKEALAVGLGSVSEFEIDRINILRATHKAMRQAVANLSIKPDMVLVDGFWLPGLKLPCMGIVDGDARSYSVAAASIVAKVYRDSLMVSLGREYPQYGFERNKGYGSEAHRQAIASHGPSPFHRRSFGGVREFIGAGGDCGRR